jgi:hypothetical protein
LTASRLQLSKFFRELPQGSGHCFADCRLTSWSVCWSSAITERLSQRSNHRKRVNYSGEEKAARRRFTRNVIASWKKDGEHELTDHRLTLTCAVSPRRTGLYWEATRASQSCLRQVPIAQSQLTHSAEPVDGLPGVWGWPPASLQRSPQNLRPFFKISQQAKLRDPSDQYTSVHVIDIACSSTELRIQV